MMNGRKRQVRLTESQLTQMIRRAARNVLDEMTARRRPRRQMTNEDILRNKVRRIVNETINEVSQSDWDNLAKVMYPQMKHRPDHESVVDDIVQGKLRVTKVEEPDQYGWASAYVQTTNGSWGEWVDVKLDEEGYAEQTDWNDMYMDDIKNNPDVAEAAFAEANDYIERNFGGNR